MTSVRGGMRSYEAAGGSLAVPRPAPGPVEEAGYLDWQGEQLYYVLHLAAGTRAGQVLLAGPMASERAHVYIPWVRWARYLARHGWEVMRFDYRGVGESTGHFVDMGFSSWLADLEFVAAWLQPRAPGRPLVLHGLELGALLAHELFGRGVGHAALLWSPPPSGHALLRQTLRRRLAADLVTPPEGGRRTRDQYLTALMTGEAFSVDGYPWTARLWQEAGFFGLAGEADRPGTRDRPVRIIHLGPETEPLASGDTHGGATGGRAVLNPDLDEFYAQNLAWITSVTQGGARSRR